MINSLANKLKSFFQPRFNRSAKSTNMYKKKSKILSQRDISLQTEPKQTIQTQLQNVIQTVLKSQITQFQKSKHKSKVSIRKRQCQQQCLCIQNRKQLRSFDIKNDQFIRTSSKKGDYLHKNKTQLIPNISCQSSEIKVYRGHNGRFQSNKFTIEKQKMMRHRCSQCMKFINNLQSNQLACTHRIHKKCVGILVQRNNYSCKFCTKRQYLKRI